jgi:putative peptidoglycan lipid II flippase
MKKIESIPAAAGLMAMSILLSRIFGYMREMLLAYQYGANGTTDAFYAAFQIPDLLNYFLSGGALSIAFIPLYTKAMTKDGEAAAQKMMESVLGTLGFIVVAATAILWWKAEALIRFQFPRFDEETTAMTVHLTRIVLPAQIFFITGGIIQAVLLAHKNFYAAAVAPFIYNVCIIAGGYFLHDSYGIAGFAIGTIAGAFLGPFLMPVIFAAGHIPLRARFAPRDKAFMVYLGLAAPLMFGQTLLTLDEWYNRWFGALLPEGSVAYLSYARKLIQVPIAVIGQALAAASLPTLSKLWAEGKVEELNKNLLLTMRVGLGLSILATMALFIFAGPVIAIVYQHGAFNAVDARIVADLVIILTLAIPAWVLQQISLRAFYARSDTWRPMVLGTILSLAVIPIYMSFGENLGIYGLAYAGVIGMYLNALATLIFARRLHKAPKFIPLLISLCRSLAIAIPSTAGAIVALRYRAAHFATPDVSGKVDAFIDLFVGSTALIMVAIPAFFIFAGPDLRQGMKNFLRRKLLREVV